MEFNLLHLVIFLSLAVVASHAAVAPEAYWKSVLPSSPMPNAIKHLLHNGWNQEKSTDVGVGKGGISISAPGTNIGIGKGGVSVHAPGTNVGVGKGGGVSVHAPGTNVGVGKGGGVSVHAPGTNVGAGKGGVSVNAPGTNVGVRKFSVSVQAPGTNVAIGKGGGVFVNAPGTNVGVGKGGVSVHAPGTNVGVGKGGGVSVYAPGTNVGAGKGGVSVHAPGTNVGVGKGGGVSVHAPDTNIGVKKISVSVHAPGTNVGVGKGGVSVHAPGTNVGVGKGGGISVHAPGTNVGVGKGGVSVHAPGTNVGVGKGGGVSVHAPGTNVSVGNGTSVHVKKPKPKCSDISVGKGGVIVHCDPKGKPVNVVVGSPFLYKYAASDDQLKDDPNVALFFLENDLHQGKSMNLHFSKTTGPSVGFLPRDTAEKIPFSSNKLPEIYDHFSVNPNSAEAESMKKTINECEEKGSEGEEKYCATSLESMVDFTTSKLGKKVRAVSTEVNAKETTPLQNYKIMGAKKLAANEAVVCHEQNYVYAVFYCHKTTRARPYSVSLLGEDGTKAKAVAVCHTDTAKWNPKHLAFRVLNVKPGTVPVCHFLPEDHIVWVPY